MFNVLTQVMSEDRIENGIWVQIYREDADGDKILLFADAPKSKERPSMALIRSDDSSAIRKYNLSLGAKAVGAMRRGKAPANTDDTVKELVSNEFKLLTLRLLALKDCDVDTVGGVQEMTDETIGHILDNSSLQFLVTMVGKVAADRSMYGPDSGNEAGPAPAPKTKPSKSA